MVSFLSTKQCENLPKTVQVLINRGVELRRFLDKLGMTMLLDDPTGQVSFPRFQPGVYLCRKGNGKFCNESDFSCSNPDGLLLPL